MMVIGALLAAIALLLVLVVWLLSAGDSGSHNEASSAGQSASAPEDLSALKVTAGKGGTKVSPIDGMTQIGYPQTCAGAVAAATNYLNDLDQTRITSGEITTDKFAKLYFDRTRLPKEERARAVFDDQKLKEYAKLYNTRALWRPEWGGFKVISCTPEKKAEVGLFYAVSADRKSYIYLIESSKLIWDDGDWRYVSPGSIDPPVTDYPDKFAERPESVQKEMEGKNGWTLYQNIDE